MTIDEAIELLGCASQGFPVVKTEPYYKAMELGVEALKRCKAYKKAHIGLHYTPMLGETE